MSEENPTDVIAGTSLTWEKFDKIKKKVDESEKKLYNHIMKMQEEIDNAREE